MVGHKTESVYRRYTITDEAMLRDASARLAALHEAEREADGTTRLVAWDGVEPPTRGFSAGSAT